MCFCCHTLLLVSLRWQCCHSAGRCCAALPKHGHLRFRGIMPQLCTGCGGDWPGGHQTQLPGHQDGGCGGWGAHPGQGVIVGFSLSLAFQAQDTLQCQVSHCFVSSNLTKHGEIQQQSTNTFLPEGTIKKGLEHPNVAAHPPLQLLTLSQQPLLYLQTSSF